MDYVRLLFTGFIEVARRPRVWRRSLTRHRAGAISRAAGRGDRQPEGPRHERTRRAEFRPRKTGRVSQGAACDAARCEIQPADLYVCGYAGCISGLGRRRTRAGRSDRAQSARDVAVAGADHRHHHRGRRLGRRAGDCRGRPRVHDGEFDLLGDFSRRMRLDSCGATPAKPNLPPSR